MTFTKAWQKCKAMGGYIPCPRDSWANNQLYELIRDWYTTIVCIIMNFITGALLIVVRKALRWESFNLKLTGISDLEYFFEFC